MLSTLMCHNRVTAGAAVSSHRHPIFANKSYHKQAPVVFQLMVALQRLGHSGNAASLLCYASEYALAGESFNLLKVSEFPRSSYLTCIDALNIPRGNRLLVYPSSPSRSAELGGGIYQMAGPRRTRTNRQSDWQCISIFQVCRLCRWLIHQIMDSPFSQWRTLF